MVERFLLAFDSEALLIDGSSPFGTAGNPIINNSNTPDGTIFEFQAGFGRNDVRVEDEGGDPDIFEDDTSGANGQPGSHTIIDGGGLVAAGTPVESESIIFLRALDDFGREVGPEIRLTVFSKDGITQDVWGFATDDFLVPGVKYKKVDGSNNGDSEYEDFIPCFVAGTRVRTPSGHVAIEDIDPGDEVWTRNGAKPVRWIGSTEIEGKGALAPIRFAPGAIGNTRELLVSPQHRMLVEGKGPELLFQSEAVLVAAKHLLGLPGVERVEIDTVEYVHLMFDAHEVIEAEGALSESFFPGDVAINSLDGATRDELLTLFPQLRDNAYETAAPCLTRYDTEVMRAFLANT